jgi:glycosyltransferase involved in cell wall biosynthesis
MDLMKHNICVFTRTLGKGGAEKQSILLTQALAQSFDTTLIVLHGEYENNYHALIDRNPIPIIMLRGNILTKFRHLSKIFKEKKTDIIFSYLFSTNILGSLAAKIAGVKYIIGGIRSSVHAPFKEILYKFFHNHIVDFTISNNHLAKNLLVKKNYNPDKFIVIENGIDLHAEIVGRENKGVIKLLSVGRFDSSKDYSTALSVVKILIENYDFPIKYFLIGYGELENFVKEQISKLGLKKNVELIIAPSNLPDYYEQSDIYLSTSIFEGFSNSIMEAMNYSLPIIATNVGDNPYLIDHGFNGYLCEVKNSKQICEKLIKLINDPDLRKKMGSNSYQKLKENYSFEAFKDKYLGFIASLN